MRSCYLLTAGVCFFSLPVTAQSFPSFKTDMRSVHDIPLPPGYERIHSKPGSFAAYLADLPLRKDKTVYLYNGSPKSSQSLHYAVIDISTGNKDLQQCADLIMRMRAEYFYANERYDSIFFRGSGNTIYRYTDYSNKCTGDQRTCFLSFMEKVFANCGTYTLEASLKKVPGTRQMQSGDIFIKGGAPGHAEIVVDMAVNKQTGQKIFLLAEGYMPAQDAHILLNPLQANSGPWYILDDKPQIVTATWIFTANQLRRF